MATMFQPFSFLGNPTTGSRPISQRQTGTVQQIRQNRHSQDTFDAPKIKYPLLVLPLSPEELMQVAKNPLRQAQLLKAFEASPSINTKGQRIETPASRLAMYHRISQQLTPQEQQTLNTLLYSRKNPLLQTQGDTPHSTLYYLYALAFGNKAPGWDSKTLLKDALNILAHPQDIEQENTPLNPDFQTALLDAVNQPTGDKHNAQVLPNKRSVQDVNVIRTFNCSEAAEMSRMASQNPKELMRHLVELTSPVESFYEKATAEELAPENPQEASNELVKRNMAFQRTPEGGFLVEMPASRAAVIRAQNTQAKLLKGQALGAKEASPLQVLYQETLLYNGGRKAYDVASDKRDMLDIAQTGIWALSQLSDTEKQQLCSYLQIPQADEARQQFMQGFAPYQAKLPAKEVQGILESVWGENSGLTGDEKLFNERLVNDGKAFQLVQYQVLDAPMNANASNYGDLYLYGYRRDFKQIEGDLVNALAQGEEPILNESISMEGGLTVAGHEVKLEATDVDPKTGERRFYLVNTDDYAKGLEQVKARDFIPKVGHVSLPKQLSQPIQSEMDAVQGILIPDENDAKHYDLQPTVPLSE